MILAYPNISVKENKSRIRDKNRGLGLDPLEGRFGFG